MENVFKDCQPQKLLASIDFFEESIILKRYNKDGIIESEVSGDDIAKAFRGVRFSSGIMNRNIIYISHSGGKENIIKYIKPQIRRLSIKPSNKGETIDVPMPPMLFFGAGKTYRIFAIKDKAIDDLYEETELYNAPLSNVDLAGLICHGDVAFPSCKASNIAQAEKLFFESVFSAHSIEHKCKSDAKNILNLLWNLSGGAYKFPKNELIKANMVFGDLIRGDK